MAETPGKNNPRAQHASQPVGKSNNPRHSQPVGANNPRNSQPIGKVTNNPRHSQPVGSNNPRHSQPVGSNNPRHSQPLPKQPALEGTVADAMPVLPPMAEPNPYSRGATGDDYAKDRRRKKRKRILLGVLAFVLVGVLGATGAAWAYISGIEQEMNEDITPEVVEALEAPAEYDGGTFYMLLMGTDKSAAREQSTQYAGDTFRSDSMILTRVDPQNKKVTMVSMHRDTEIEIEGYGLQKLNASYAIGGPALAIKTVSQMAGVPISHYAEINFDGFEEVVDALGGVEVDVPMEINDDEAGGHVDAGEQTLTGEEALILCRSRHSYDEYGDGDRYRAANQRLVLGANGTQRQTFGETRTGIVTIKNGNGINGVGAEALERIKPLGYTADASNANSFSYEETVVVFDTPDQRVYAEELIDALGCGRAVQNTDGEYVYDGDFLILIGSDWQ